MMLCKEKNIHCAVLSSVEDGEEYEDTINSHITKATGYPFYTCQKSEVKETLENTGKICNGFAEILSKALTKISLIFTPKKGGLKDFYENNPDCIIPESRKKELFTNSIFEFSYWTFTNLYNSWLLFFDSLLLIL